MRAVGDEVILGIVSRFTGQGQREAPPLLPLVLHISVHYPRVCCFQMRLNLLMAAS